MIFALIMMMALTLAVMTMGTLGFFALRESNLLQVFHEEFPHGRS